MIAKVTTVFGLLLASCLAVPSSIDSRSLRLDNGDSSVEVTYSDVVRRENLGGLVARQSSINCDGSAFCERLGSSCDDAFRKIEASNTYSSDNGPENSGTCSGTCGIFIGSQHCEASGQELINAYNDIRSKGHCTHCGTWRRDKDGCIIKIDRVTGCK